MPESTIDEGVVDDYRYFFFERSGFPALIYNKEKEATVITCMRSITPHSLSCEEFKKTQESYYTLDSCTTNRGFKKIPPARDHKRYVTLILLKTAVLLNTINFKQLNLSEI